MMAHRQRLTLHKFTDILHNTEFEFNFSLFFFLCVCEKTQTFPSEIMRHTGGKNYLQYDEVCDYNPKNDRLFSSLLSNCIMTAANFMKI